MDGDFHCAFWQSEPALLNQRVCRVIPDENRYRKSFLRWVLPGYLAAINADTSSVTVKHLSSNTVKHLSSRTVSDIPLPYPQVDEQDRIVAEVERRLSVVDELETLVATNLARAGRLRQSILAKAFSGELVPCAHDAGG